MRRAIFHRHRSAASADDTYTPTTTTAATRLSIFLLLAEALPTEGSRTHKGIHNPANWPAPIWHNQTLQVKLLAESHVARCQEHRVQLPDGKGVADNWVYFDERPHINVLVRLKDGNKFVVFRQRKYATEGETLAPVGGYIENGETPTAAAKRELEEELGLRTPKMQFLGSFISSANRGGGRFYTFFADQCVALSADRPSTVATIQAGGVDVEAQRVVLLSRNELREAVLSSRFQEAKWTATVALALLNIEEDGTAARPPNARLCVTPL